MMPLDIKALRLSTRAAYKTVLLIGLLLVIYMVLSARNLTVTILAFLVFFPLFYPTVSHWIRSDTAYILHLFSMIIGVYVAALFWISNFGFMTPIDSESWIIEKEPKKPKTPSEWIASLKKVAPSRS